RVDRRRLEHAILSLVVRARETMTDRGQVAIATSFVRHAGARRIALSITDTGPGPPEAERPSALDGFDLAMTSTLGRGSSVTIFLDPAPPPVVVPVPPPSSRRGPAESD